jgi:hypothetical protein
MKKIGAAVLPFLLPALALAADSGDFGEISTFIGKISSFINGTLIPLLFGLALLVFLWGMFKYFILGGGEDESREEGRKLMMWAIIGFVVMVSVFGIVNMIANGLGFSGDETIQNIPDVPTNNT